MSQHFAADHGPAIPRRARLSRGDESDTQAGFVQGLQRLAGNRAVTALLARMPSVGITVQRACSGGLGPPNPDRPLSTKGVVGWQLLFAASCDELLPGELAKIDRLRPGYNVEIQGFASSEGPADFNDRLSSHRANRVAEVVATKRADCQITGVFKHDASPGKGPGIPKDPNPRSFHRAVIITEDKPPVGSGEQWLDPTDSIRIGWSLYAKAKKDPTTANLHVLANDRTQLKTWLELTPKTMAPAGMQLKRKNIDDFRRIWSSAEELWKSSDQLLAAHKHSAAAKDTHAEWAAETPFNDPAYHAHDVPPGAKYHIDLFGEGYHAGAVNIGRAQRSQTTAPEARVPNAIYRSFSYRDVKVNKIPIADHVADVVTAEAGPIDIPGLVEEIARITAPGGTVIIVGPKKYEDFHDRLAHLTGGTISKRKSGRSGLESRIVVPRP
ncbi:OmpA family protein [Pseudonocardia charpentierae]|uniref:OmpA-like domain-containing protein n=1 Tax=Pseudonocardia charpentierae TaxID=3075545 RepID=A0ABU2NJ92_9PSEU|nr:hypothetical protein [Pseudonocardia sp. DSM 45834]MDT0354047.1 hypothetical protein [Pseudonocardia sp. DSM 45834]